MEEYDIYGMTYIFKDFKSTKFTNVAMCSAESDKDAKNLLKKSLEDKGLKLEDFFDLKIKKTEFKTKQKGLIFSYNFLSDKSF